MNLMNMKYEMVICWSEEDDCYLVGFPDFSGQKWRTHGDTYEIAVNSGVVALESLINAYEISGVVALESLINAYEISGVVALESLINAYEISGESLPEPKAIAA